MTLEQARFEMDHTFTSIGTRLALRRKSWVAERSMGRDDPCSIEDCEATDWEVEAKLFWDLW
jgi:hypothetical protein